MREIKFRAWDIEENRMFHHFDLPDQYLIGLDATVWDTKKPDKFGLGLGDVVKDKFVLQQFTGLKDKNRQEIWEGDIIKRGTGYKFEMKLGQYILGRPTDSKVYGYNWQEGDEVIGNIYEHPELLKP